MRTAVFLGAGASKPFGYPLTSEILPAIRQQLKKQTSLFGDSDTRRAAAAELKELLLLLLPGFENDSLARPLVTDVFSLIDHSLSTGHILIPHKNRSALARL